MRRNRQLVALTICLMLVAAGCAHRTPIDTAKITATGMVKAYFGVYETYKSLMESKDFPMDGKIALRTNVAPKLDDFKSALLMLNDAIIAWQKSGIQPADFASLEGAFKAKKSIAEAAITTVMNQFAGGVK